MLRLRTGFGALSLASLCLPHETGQILAFPVTPLREKPHLQSGSPGTSVWLWETPQGLSFLFCEDEEMTPQRGFLQDEV